MNEQAIIDAYNLFVQNGYNKSIDDYKKLLASNSEAVQDSYKLFVGNGYNKSIDDFKSLMGLGAQVTADKKKVATVSSLEDGSLGLQKPERAVAESTMAKPIMLTQPPKEEEDKYGLLSNVVSALDRGFLKNFIGSPVKALGTFIEGTTKAAIGGTGKGPVSDALIKFGDYFNNTIDELTPQDEEFKNTLTDQFAQAFGQVASLVATGGIAGAATKGAGALGAAETALAAQAAPKAITTAGALKTIGGELASPVSISAGLSMGQSEFDRAKQAGATDDQAFEAFYKNAAIGSVLEKVPVMQFLKRFNKASAGGLTNYIKTKGVAGITGGLEEMSTEVLQQLYANKTAQEIYNVNQDLFEGVGESGGVGFGVGFLLNAMGANAKLLRKEGKQQEANVVEGQIKQLETRAEKGGVSSYKLGGVKIKDPKIINDMIDNMSAGDLAKANIEITNDPELKIKLQDKIVTSSIKEQVRESNPNLSEEQLDEVTNLEKELKKFEGNTTQSGKDRAAAIRSQIKTIQENAIQKQTAGEVPVQPTPGVSEKVEEGKPQPKPEVVTTEGVQEAVTPEVTKEKVETITTLNPTGTIFTDYTAEQRDVLPLGENITTYDKTANVNPTDKIIVYRGVPEGVNEIKSGDFVTTNQKLASDYAGTGKVISMEVNASDILDDKTEPLGEEYILRIPKPEVSLKTQPIDFSKQLEEKYGVAVDLLGNLESDKPLSLSRIVVPEEQRRQGIGSQVMKDIIEYADKNNKKLTLTPSTDFGGESVAKLTDFYKQFGFVENKGDAKDFTIKDAMYRTPAVQEPVSFAIPKRKKITVDEMAALKSQIRFEARAAKEGAKSVSDAIKAINQYFNDLKDRANLTRADLKKVVNIVSKVKNQQTLDKAAEKIYQIVEKANTDVIEVSESKALKDQLRLEARAAREAKGDLNKKRKQLIDAVRKMGTEGKMDVKKVNALINRIGKINLDSQIAVDKFVDYAEKVFADAEYANKLGAATTMRKQLNKLSKNKDKAANLRDLGAKFSEIDPSMVEDIDTYNKMASMMVESIKGSSIRGKDVKFADVVRQDEVIPYINAQMEAQRKKLFDMKVAEVQELLGVDASELNYEQLIEMLAQGKEMPKDNEKIVRSAVNKAFDIFSTMIKESVKTGKDLFTGEDVTYTPSQKRIIGEFMDMNLDELSPKEALEAVDGLMNFIQNGSTAKMETVVKSYTGKVNAKELANEGIKASPLRKYWSKPLGRFLGEQTTNLNVLFEKMFKGVERGGKVENMSGVTALKNGKSAGQSEANAIVNDYVNKFYDKKANGDAFNTDFNNVERGMAAFMMRNVIGTQAEIEAEFNRRKNLVSESIAELEKGNDKEKEKAKVYQEVFDKILSDANTIEDVTSKVDKTNMEAVNFWQQQWANKYDELADVSLNVYNKILGKDINYNPDKFTKLSSETGDVEISTDDMAFHINNGTIYKKETGVLMEATRPESLPKNPKNGETSMYIDLSFDKNNANSMYDALVDIKTAGPIRQVESFLNSASLKKIVPQAEDAEILKDRVGLFVNNIRNKNPYSNDELSKAVRSLNKIAAVGVGQSLGGVLQPIKQVIPVAMNTLINGGGLDLGAVLNPAKSKFISDSGYAIANRGIESQAQVESIDRLMEKAATSKGEKALKFIEEANKKWLQIFLVKPDVFIARASWMTYYEQSLQKQGIDPKTIDYNTHEINKEAADYAQRQVDRQQNVSDADLAGKLFADKEPTKQVMIKMLMPFASFRMNQASRLGADLGTLMSNVSTKEDKKIAARSLAGFGVEMAVFRMISVGSALLIANLVKKVMGRKDDEEKDKKKMDAIVKGQLTSTVADMFSPLPITDKLVQAGVAGALKKTQDALDVADEDRVSIYSGNKQDLLQSFGLFGIAADRAAQIYEIANLSSGGSFEDDYGRKKYISPKDREALQLLIAPALLTNIGLAPSEVNSVIRSSITDAKRNASTKESGIKETKGGAKMSKQDMKKYFPDMYNEMYGPGGSLYEIEQIKKEVKKEKEALKQ